MNNTIIYEFNSKNKFPHLILIPFTIALNYQDLNKNLKLNEIDWIKKNIGEYRKKWIYGPAQIYKNKKIKWNKILHENLQDVLYNTNFSPARQYGFLHKDDALHFKLVIG